VYKSGEFVNENSGDGQLDPTIVFVGNPGAFTVDEPVHVFSSQHPEGEFVTVVALGSNHIVVSDQGPGGPPTALKNFYPDSIDPAAAGPPYFDIAPYAFVARTSAGVFDILPNTFSQTEAYDDTFTEWAIVSASGVVPAWLENDPLDNGWFDVRSSSFFSEFDKVAAKPRVNHVQLVAGSEGFVHPGMPAVGMSRADNDLPGFVAAPNWSWVFWDISNDQCPGGCTATEIQAIVDGTSAHELGHQWNVNPDQPGRHDTESSLDPGNKCLMHAIVELVDILKGVVRFHLNPLPTAPRDLVCIREHIDDLNDDSCEP